MLLNKSVTAAELVAARRLIRKSATKSAVRAGTPEPVDAPAAVQPAALASQARGDAAQDERAPAAWKKTVWSETAFEPRGT
jgi:hypothetical protein